ncbi:hypothetical protein [Jannaschia formosa]|uniref:hypothetical protein n=1 Tax=Jannaschia formosa TaxID=2259592 RepID=UPI000E1B87C2|nr:hypothetical protein [Jannaschia formosa]TFL18066.1 hypothetical protein DR046_11515 [Jannaschia formosa]
MRSRQRANLAAFGPLPLAAVQGKVRTGAPVSIVQQPGGETFRWVANEGIRISRLVAHLRAARESGDLTGAGAAMLVGEVLRRGEEAGRESVPQRPGPGIGRSRGWRSWDGASPDRACLRAENPSETASPGRGGEGASAPGEGTGRPRIAVRSPHQTRHRRGASAR